MTGKPKPPARPARKAPVPTAQAPVPNTAPPPDARWQRTVRYGWDKGGARGGRK
jgi:hypothetical protein